MSCASHCSLDPRREDATGLLTLASCTQPSGRLSVPYVMIYYLPVTCNAELKMLYAGAKELMRNTAEVGKVIEMADAEEMAEIEGVLGGEG